MSVKKYFIGIVLPSPVLREAEELKHELQKRFGLKGALRSPAHITLHRPFEWKVEKENQLIEKLKAFDFAEPFEIKLTDFDFFEPRVIFVNVEQNPKLDSLHKRLTAHARREMNLFNEAEDRRGFHPHVTIANRDMKKPLFYELKIEFEKRKFSASFLAEGFSLLRLEEKWKEVKPF